MVPLSLLPLRLSSLSPPAPPPNLPSSKIHGLLSRIGGVPRLRASLFLESKRTQSLRSGDRRGIVFTCSYKNKEKSKTSSPEKGSTLNWAILERWDVPWKWQTVLLTTVACGVSSVTAVVLGVIYGITSTFQPLPDDIFCYDWKEPFNLRDGWLLWAGIGFSGALIAISVAGAAFTIFNGENPQRETDALVRLLPLIGSSSISTACLVGITGVLAPLLEETVFRGFLMVSLTKWFPTPVSVLISATVFALAHLTPGEFPQLFVLGSVLGLSYAQTRNLLTPITIHALWNSGVILLLTFLQIQGYDIREMLQAS